MPIAVKTAPDAANPLHPFFKTANFFLLVFIFQIKLRDAAQAESQRLNYRETAAETAQAVPANGFELNEEPTRRRRRWFLRNGCSEGIRTGNLHARRRDQEQASLDGWKFQFLLVKSNLAFLL